jgi:hypothetical protein
MHNRLGTVPIARRREMAGSLGPDQPGQKPLSAAFTSSLGVPSTVFPDYSG